MSTVKQVGFKIFLNITPTVTNWTSDNNQFSLIFDENPLADFVELPDDGRAQDELWFSNILCGVLRGALEMVRIQNGKPLWLPEPSDLVYRCKCKSKPILWVTFCEETIQRRCGFHSSGLSRMRCHRMMNNGVCWMGSHSFLSFWGRGQSRRSVFIRQSFLSPSRNLIFWPCRVFVAVRICCFLCQWRTINTISHCGDFQHRRNAPLSSWPSLDCIPHWPCSLLPGMPTYFFSFSSCKSHLPSISQPKHPSMFMLKFSSRIFHISF